MDYRIEILDEHTWLIEEYDSKISVYQYLLEGEERAVLIDTGMGTIPLDTICRKLTEKPITVLLTHGHVDHIGGTNLFEHVLLKEEDINTYCLHSSDLRKQFYAGALPPVKAKTEQLKDGDVFSLGGRTVEVVGTPGHSLGSVCFLDRERKWMFTGDTCCKAHVLLQMEYAAPLTDYLSSIRSLISRRETYTLTWPAHHEKPVEKEILHQYLEAAEGLLSGTRKGSDFEIGGKTCRLLSYKEIGIEY